jgi:hypothetical protein
LNKKWSNYFFIAGETPTLAIRSPSIMKEKDLKKLGFSREFTTDLVDDEPAFYYYTLEIENLCLISSDSDAAANSGNEWVVEIFSHPTFRFESAKQLKKFIRILNKNRA